MFCSTETFGWWPKVRWSEKSGEAGEVLGLIQIVFVVNQTET